MFSIFTLAGTIALVALLYFTIARRVTYKRAPVPASGEMQSILAASRGSECFDIVQDPDTFTLDGSALPPAALLPSELAKREKTTATMPTARAEALQRWQDAQRSGCWDERMVDEAQTAPAPAPIASLSDGDDSSSDCSV